MLPQEVAKRLGATLGSTELTQRDVVIEDPTGTPRLFARSWIRCDALSEPSKGALEAEQRTIGEILHGNKEPYEYRDLRVEEITSQRLAPVFGKQGSLRFLQRAWEIRVNKRPAVLIHEFEPAP
jgi:chorismate-pyruvate lyase